MPKLCPVCGTSYPDALVFCPADATALRAAEVHGSLIGSVVADRYLVTDLLGEGGMGTVYLARHVRLPQQAAIKVLRKDMLRDSASVARFNREAANASRIDHDRVARVYDFGETDDGVVYLAMEFVQGPTLKKIIADGGPMAPERVGRIVRQIAEALDAAHRMGIVHRDLKPDNIMVIEDADDAERVKVVDFGIAKAFGNDEGAGPGLTKTGFVVGTPEFMSPEQLLGGSLDARSDIYALAIVAYQCLTGELPFATDTPDRGMAARLMTPARPLVAVSPDVRWPAEVQAVFDQALAREPAQRQASAGAFARALAAAIERWQNAARESAALPVATAAAAPPAPPSPRADPAPLAGPRVEPQPSPAVLPVDASSATRGTGARSGVIVGAVIAVLVVLAGAGAYLARGRGAPVPADTVVASTPPTPSGGTTAAGPVPDVSAPNGSAPNSSTPTPIDTPATTLPGPVATTGSRTTAPTPGAPAPNAPRPTAERPTVTPLPTGTRSSIGSASAAKRTLDSVSKALDPNTADEATARAALPILREIIPRLGDANDSTFALIRLAEAYLLTNDMPQGCAAYRRARAAAPTSTRRADVQRFIDALSCP